MKITYDTQIMHKRRIALGSMLQLFQFVIDVRPKKITLFLEDRVAKKSLTRAATKIFFLKKENKH